ncbi:MAG: hypothetical protein JXR69_10665 [Candidatus Delongbacteria bacterium]|nr:hypothetical protein [Candidatus Delongbacteria bacterium]
MILTSGIILAFFVILLDLKFISLGVKHIDPLRDSEFILKFALPAVIFEISYIIWVSINLPNGVLFAILILSVSGMMLKSLKFEGYKFYLYVLIPLSEIIIIVYSMIMFVIND